MQSISELLMRTTEEAHRSLCENEEAAVHYGEPFGRWDAWCCWWAGFFDAACSGFTSGLR